MINQLGSMMDNLSDVYYLVQLIVRQIFVYLRDLILYKFLWLGASNDDVDASESKLRSLTSKNITADILAFSILCAVLFLLALLASKCEKTERQRYVYTDRETTPTNSQEEPYCVSSRSSSSTNCVYPCGDSICSRRRFVKRNFSDEDLARVRSSSRKSNASIPKKSIFGLSGGQPQNSQSTQTTEMVFHKTAQKWLIRRTRSGQIYGKYPV